MTARTPTVLASRSPQPFGLPSWSRPGAASSTFNDRALGVIAQAGHPPPSAQAVPHACPNAGGQTGAQPPARGRFGHILHVIDQTRRRLARQAAGLSGAQSSVAMKVVADLAADEFSLNPRTSKLPYARSRSSSLTPISPSWSACPGATVGSGSTWDLSRSCSAATNATTRANTSPSAPRAAGAAGAASSSSGLLGTGNAGASSPPSFAGAAPPRATCAPCLTDTSVATRWAEGGRGIASKGASRTQAAHADPSSQPGGRGPATCHFPRNGYRSSQQNTQQSPSCRTRPGWFGTHAGC